MAKRRINITKKIFLFILIINRNIRILTNVRNIEKVLFIGNYGEFFDDKLKRELKGYKEIDGYAGYVEKERVFTATEFVSAVIESSACIMLRLKKFKKS
ncbi:MAG: hypothetical protein ACE5Z5_05530 [Candidatus Bathyarchaeia archaeon]